MRQYQPHKIVKLGLLNDFFIAIWTPEYVPLTTVFAVAVSIGSRWLRSAREPPDRRRHRTRSLRRSEGITSRRLEELEFSTWPESRLDSE